MNLIDKMKEAQLLAAKKYGSIEGETEEQREESRRGLLVKILMDQYPGMNRSQYRRAVDIGIEAKYKAEELLLNHCTIAECSHEVLLAVIVGTREFLADLPHGAIEASAILLKTLGVDPKTHLERLQRERDALQ